MPERGLEPLMIAPPDPKAPEKDAKAFWSIKPPKTVTPKNVIPIAA
jgi:hypothetical protein